MSATTVLAIAVPVLVVAAGVLLFAAARRRDTGSATGTISHETARYQPPLNTPHAPNTPPDASLKGPG
jgi:hypothetical protein